MMKNRMMMGKKCKENKNERRHRKRWVVGLAKMGGWETQLTQKGQEKNNRIDMNKGPRNTGMIDKDRRKIKIAKEG